MEIRPILSALFRNKTAPLLIAAQVALTLAIVCNAVYIIRDRLATAARPSGADEANLAEIRLYPHRPIADIKGMQIRDLDAIRAIPGVVSVAWTNQVPLGRSGWNIGGLSTSSESTDSTLSAAQYFSGQSMVQTFGLNLVEGRDFLESEFIESDPQKDRNLPSVALITQALAKQLWPQREKVVGETFFLGNGGAGGQSVQVVGVVEKLQSPWAQTSPEAEHGLLLPMRYLDPFTRYTVRTEPGRQAQVMAEVEKALLALSNDRVLLGNRTFAEIRDARYASERLMAGLLIAVTGFLLLITASGIVGMASLWVNQRRKQIGVRRALGARRIDVLRYFLVENVLIVSAGGMAGLLLALLLNDQLVRHLQIARLPVEYLGIGMLAMWLLGLAAVLAPAMRAAAVPPAVATRTA